MQSQAATVLDYVTQLPADRREAIEAVRGVILKNLDKTYEEGMHCGMICYFAPNRTHPAGHLGDPRPRHPFVALTSRKNHMSLGIMSNFLDSPEEKWFKAAWAKTGKKLNMGACCIRFKKVEDLALDVIGESIRRTPAEKYIEQYQAARQGTDSPWSAANRRAPKKASPKKPLRKKVLSKNPTTKKSPKSVARSTKKRPRKSTTRK